MAALLRTLYLDPRVGPEILQSLSVGGIDGTTRNRFKGTLAAERVRAKTGTLNGKSCLSGLVGDGSDVLAFSILVEGIRGRHLARRARRAGGVRERDDALRVRGRGEPSRGRDRAHRQPRAISRPVGSARARRRVAPATPAPPPAPLGTAAQKPGDPVDAYLRKAAPPMTPAQAPAPARGARGAAAAPPPRPARPLVARALDDAQANASRIAASARSMPAASTSRWVTARRRVGAMTCSRTPAASTRAARSVAVPRRTSKMTMLVSTRGAVDRDAVDRRQPLGEPARVGVIVGEAVAMVLERVQRARAQHADLAHAAAQHLAEAARALDVLARARR